MYFVDFDSWASNTFPIALRTHEKPVHSSKNQLTVLIASVGYPSLEKCVALQSWNYFCVSLLSTFKMCNQISGVTRWYTYYVFNSAPMLALRTCVTYVWHSNATWILYETSKIRAACWSFVIWKCIWCGKWSEQSCATVLSFDND